MITSLTETFVDALSEIIDRAIRQASIELSRQLDIGEDDIVKPTAANNAVLRRIDAIVAKRLERSGFSTLIDAFVSRFDSQLPFFEEILGEMGLRPPRFGRSDLAAFSGVKLGAATTLEGLKAQAGIRAVRNAALSFNALPIDDLVEQISTEYRKTIGESRTIGSTGMSTFYRTVADRGFAIIERDSDAGPLKFRYAGPKDKLTREFCEGLLAKSKAGKSWTREQIGRMDNGSTLSNVFTHCGGWNCRHQWILANASTHH